MRSRFFMLVLLAIIILATESPGQPDTSAATARAKPPIVVQQQTVRKAIELPQLRDRLWMCGVALVLLGGLALGINRLRIDADRQTHRNNGRNRV